MISAGCIIGLFSLSRDSVGRLGWRIRVIRSFWYPRGYQILRVSHILHAIFAGRRIARHCGNNELMRAEVALAAWLR